MWISCRRYRLLMPVLLFCAMLLSGCATQTAALLSSRADDIPTRVELKDTPFFPQQEYQCGPAALATVLQAAGIPVLPEALVSQVYVPAREGSLPPEMLTAARRNGAVSITLAPRLHDLLAEVAAGNPVIVLQNLSLPIYPLWHYAVVIGYDLAEREIVLRSGTTERLTMSISTFENTWRRSGHWAMLALAPGRVPRTASESALTDALVEFEKHAEPSKAHAAYSAALQRWPRNPGLQLGVGNSAYRAGDLPQALAAFRRAADMHPDSVAALNNLASVLMEFGQLDQAKSIATRAVALGGPLQSVAQQTLAEIVGRQQSRASGN